MDAPPAPLVVYSPLLGSNGHSFNISTAGDWLSNGLTKVAVEPADEAVPATSPAAELEIPEGLFAPAAPLLKGKTNDPPPGVPAYQTVEKLIPPNRAAYISDSQVLSISEKLGKNIGCDRIMNDSKVEQTIEASYRADFHCYWVDGASVATPHFMVLVKQVCAFNPCAKGRTDLGNYAWEGWTKGFFLATLKLEPVTLIAHGAKSQVLEKWEPRGHSEKGGKAFNFAHTMQLRVDDGHGGRSNSIPFTAEYSSANYFDNWKYKDQVDLSVNKPSWMFHLDQRWDPSTTPVHQFGGWWVHVYDKDQVCDFGKQSITTLNMTSISAWRVDSSVVTGDSGAPEPSPATLEFYGGIRAFMPAMHNSAGCTVSTHHLWWHDRYWHFRKFIRLDDICKR